MGLRRRVLSAVALTVALAAGLVLGSIGGAAVRAGPAADWDLIAPEHQALELVAPASGALFARDRPRGQELLARSDDGGASWATVPLPPSSGRTPLAIDPSAHWVMYAGGEEGLYKTVDDGGNWALVLPTSRSTSERVERVAVSPADAELVYVGLFVGGDRPEHFRVVRSRDGGTTWVELQDHSGARPCWWDTSIFDPHPTDANRMFSTVGCYGPPTEAPLRHSADQGATWSPSVQLSGPRLGVPRQLVGGRGVAPGRFYLASEDRVMWTPTQVRVTGSSLFRSDDGGITWTNILSVLTLERSDISALAYDPSDPDRVYLGRGRGGGEVQLSRDGGATWATLGRSGLGRVSSVALGIDGRNLYAGTDQGVWRLALAEP